MPMVREATESTTLSREVMAAATGFPKRKEGDERREWKVPLLATIVCKRASVTGMNYGRISTKEKPWDEVGCQTYFAESIADQSLPLLGEFETLESTASRTGAGSILIKVNVATLASTTKNLAGVVGEIAKVLQTFLDILLAQALLALTENGILSIGKITLGVHGGDELADADGDLLEVAHELLREGQNTTPTGTP